MKEELPMNAEEQLLKLVEGVASLNTKVDGVQKSVDEMKEMSKTVAAHGTAIGKIEESLKRGSAKFDRIDAVIEKLEKRIDVLEKAEGEKAKATVAAIVKYVLVAFAGAVVANLSTIINTLGGK